MKPVDIKTIIDKALQCESLWTKPQNLNLPYNYVSVKPYSGYNLLSLFATTLSRLEQGIPTSNYWLTFKQFEDKKLKLRKGSKGCPICYFSKYIKNGEEKASSFAKGYYVYNLLDAEVPPEDIPAVPTLESTWTLEGCKVVQTLNDCSYYSPTNDTVHIANPTSLVHELAHATGHPARLNRVLSTDQSSKEYSEEEILAEMTSLLLTGETTNRLAYIKGWYNKASYLDLTTLGWNIVRACNLLKNGATDEE